MLTDTGIGRRPAVLPRLRLPAGFVDDPAADRLDQAAVFGDRHELGRLDQAPIGMPPADERLGADDGAGLQVHLRLVEQLEFPLVDRAVQAGFDRLPFDGAHIQLGLEELVAVPPLVLGMVQRHVGTLQQRLRILAVVGVDADADADGDVELVIGERERPREGCDDLLRAHGRVLGVLQLRQHDHEFVPALPADRVGAPDAHRDFPPDDSQQLVAEQVSERVVDVFEAIDIQKEHGQASLVTVGQGQRAVEPVRQQRAVRQIGQRVMARQKQSVAVAPGSRSMA